MPFLDGVAESVCELDHGRARDAGEDAEVERRRVQDPAAPPPDVRRRAFEHDILLLTDEIYQEFCHEKVMRDGAARCAQAGEDVTFIDPWPEHVVHMREKGLTIAHASGGLEPFTDGQREAMMKLLNDIYRQFTEKAAQGRKMEYEKLEKLARGRVYMDYVIQDVDGEFDPLTNPGGVPDQELANSRICRSSTFSASPAKTTLATNDATNLDFEDGET